MFCVVLLLLIDIVYYSEGNVQISGSSIVVRQVRSLVCKSELNLLHYPGRMVAYHQWNQVYETKTDSPITNLRGIEALKTQFEVELETFDNNTDIYSVFSVYNASNGLQNVFNLKVHCGGVESFIRLVDDGFYKHRSDQMFNYVLTKTVTYSCQQYSNLSSNVQVGWINTEGNRIFVYNETKTVLNLGVTHNGSMLCCIYYTVTVDQNEKRIRRFVKHKTLLILQEEMPDTEGASAKSDEEEMPNSKGSSATSEYEEETTIAEEFSPKSTESYCGTRNMPETSNVTYDVTPNMNETISNATNETDKNSNATNETDKNSHATNETDKNSNATNIITESIDHDAVTSTNYVTIIISSVSASILALLVVIYVFKKLRQRETNRRERSQRPLPQIPRQHSLSEPNPNLPFYQNFLFRRECDQEIQAREEVQYEEVMYQ